MTARARARGSDPDESQLHALLGAGRTALPDDLAMRAREVSRPTPTDVAEAERTLVIRHGRTVGP